MSFNSVLLGTLGFMCYAAYTIPLYYSPAVIAQYSNAYNGSAPLVQPPDVFFCIWAVALEGVALSQIVMYVRGRQSVSRWTIFLLAISFIFIIIVVSLTATATGGMAVSDAPGEPSWFRCILYISYIKIGLTIIRYLPQIHLNYIRKSTEGFKYVHAHHTCSIAFLCMVASSWHFFPCN
jgi:cystinosin